MKSYYSIGSVMQTGFYLNDTLPDGVFTTYHANGQRWSEMIYKEGKGWEILFNYDQTGEPQNQGTLKNGNGTVILYNEDGKETAIMTFNNGIEIK